MRVFRFYLMYTLGILVDAVYGLRWLSEHLHRASVAAYFAAGEAWWAGEMRHNLEHAESAE